MSKKKSLPVKTGKYRIAAYVRVSTEEQAENPEGSIKNQEQRIREFVKLKNMVEPFGEIVEVFSDPGKSAKDTNRPGFQTMLRAVQNGDVDLILVTELSRFSRSTKDFTTLQDFLDDHNCRFLSMRENFDTSGAAGAMVMNMMATIAEFERRQTAERISHAFLARAKRGLYNGGSLPLGYRIDEEKPGHLSIDDEEAELVRHVFDTFLKEGTLAATAKSLNARGKRVPKRVHGSGAVREGRFGIESTYRLLKNKAYIGIRVYSTKAGWEEVPAVWKPIISKAIFDRANRILEANCSHKRTYEQSRFPYTLSGLVFCEQCGDRMSGKSAHGSVRKVGYYEHIKSTRLQAAQHERIPKHDPHRVPAEKIEPVVWAAVKSFLLKDSFCISLLNKVQEIQSVTGEEDEGKKLEQKNKLLSYQIETLAERIGVLSKDIDPQPLLDQLRRLQGLKAEMESKVMESKSTQKPKEEAISLQSLSTFRKGFKELIEPADTNLELRTKIIAKIVKKVLVRTDGLEVVFYIGKTLSDKKNGAAFGCPDITNKKTVSLAKKTVDPRSSSLTNGDPTPTRTGIYGLGNRSSILLSYGITGQLHITLKR